MLACAIREGFPERFHKLNKCNDLSLCCLYLHLGSAPMQQLTNVLVISELRFMGTPPSFFPIFSKGDNFHDFLFAYLEDKVFPKRGLLIKERICSNGSRFFP